MLKKSDVLNYYQLFLIPIQIKEIFLRLSPVYNNMILIKNSP